MRRPRRNHSSMLKTKVAMAAARGEKTLAELVDHYDVLVNQIQDWKKKHPFYESRQLPDWREENDHTVNGKHVQRLGQGMGLSTAYPRKMPSQLGTGHRIYPYALRNLTITQPNHVWATNICSIPMAKGFVYLVSCGHYRLGITASVSLATVQYS